MSDVDQIRKLFFIFCCEYRDTLDLDRILLLNIFESAVPNTCPLSLVKERANITLCSGVKYVLFAFVRCSLTNKKKQEKTKFSHQ
jgi:hypothetical protein